MLRRGGVIVTAALATVAVCSGVFGSEFKSAWSADVDRVWIGPDFWANRLQDWRLRGGRLELADYAATMPLRTVHLLTHRLTADGTASLRVRTGILGDAEAVTPTAESGFLIGAGQGMDYRAAALIHRNGGPGAGLFVGIDGQGRLFIRDLEQARPVRRSQTGGRGGRVFQFALLARSEASVGRPTDVLLELTTVPLAGGPCIITLSAVSVGSEKRRAQVTYAINAERLLGHVGLVCHPGVNDDGRAGRARFWYRDWSVGGDRFIEEAQRNCGPILSTQHTLSEKTLKMTAQMMPIGANDTQTVELQTWRGGAWTTIDRQRIRPDSYTATFRVTDWDDGQDVPYQVAYHLKQADGGQTLYTWRGVVRKDPVNKETIVVAGFTGNHNNRRNFRSGRIDWRGDIWFPHNAITSAVAKHRPDVLFFSGDQVYEGLSPTFADRQHLRLDYLYKWYLWCWAYRDLTRSIPCITIPDDHDIYQGNIWGESGRPATVDNQGGYVHPAAFVKMVEHTQVDNLPDPVDPRPVEQGIGVYFTRMTYGRIGFAVLEDRKFKSGCANRIAGRTRGRPDHINDPNFDILRADVPGLKLLGDRQLAFLHDFTGDWRGQDMKIALSQTIFANMATHHGAELFRLIADLDSNGWPQSGRNRAVDALRRGFVFHLAGDQHLGSLVHHGIDEHNDAIWSFCVPSIANFYPRAWMPEAAGRNRAPGAEPNLGEHLDGLRNKVTVYGVTNPTSITGKSTGREPLELHDKMPGYGIVRLNKRTRQIRVECWPRYVDPADPRTGTQYPGWPRTISQRDNYGRRAVAHLPTLEITGMTDAVVQVVDESNNEIVYTLRITGTRFRPWVFKRGTYTIRVGELGTARVKTLTHVQAESDNTQTRRVEL